MSQTLDLAKIHPGFLDPVRESQAVFRKVMDAVARPGSVADLAFAVDGPPGLDCAAAAVALTLFDFETPVWLDPALAGGEAEGWIRFHAGCPLTPETSRAAFALVARAQDCPPLSAFNQGDAKYPDRSTTVIVQVAGLEGGEPVVLTGPGIKTETVIAPRGLPHGFWEQLETNNAQFQYGVDVMLVAGQLLLALPRSTRAQIRKG
ncbi:MAG: phosphonate C-P lyase system protein PhnH [Phenylobacterium sp.]|nr:phosphonate C-P lyase system protein PhnH [Phenylobacterium sp.]